MGTPTRRGIERALRKLEDAAVAKARSIRPKPFDEADWLDWFAREGKAGRFKHEPDFPAAFAMLKDELVKAKASTDPPFEPPEDFQPDPRWPHIRRENWRRWPGHFPKLIEALDWLFEMETRLTQGIPPCSEAEHAELAAWFAEHEAGLDAVAKQGNRDGLMSVGDGQRVTCSHVRFYLRDGPRGEGSGRVAEEIRQLKSRYGEQAKALMAQHRGDT
jgi:hypothetical protein